MLVLVAVEDEVSAESETEATVVSAASVVLLSFWEKASFLAWTATKLFSSKLSEELPIFVAFIKFWAALEFLLAKNKPLSATTV